MVELAYPCLARKFVGLNMGKLAQPYLARDAPMGPKTQFQPIGRNCVLEKSRGDVRLASSQPQTKTGSRLERNTLVTNLIVGTCQILSADPNGPLMPFN